MRVEIDVNECFNVDIKWSKVSEAIDAAMSRDAETALFAEMKNDMKMFINNYHGCISMLSDEFINEGLSEHEREGIYNALKRQADRFAPREDNRK